MPNENYYEGIQHVVQIRSEVTSGCKVCQTAISLDDFDARINHYIEQHGYKILHIGTQTEKSYEFDGQLWHSVIAVLGK